MFVLIFQHYLLFIISTPHTTHRTWQTYNKNIGNRSKYYLFATKLKSAELLRASPIQTFLHTRDTLGLTLAIYKTFLLINEEFPYLNANVQCWRTQTYLTQFVVNTHSLVYNNTTQTEVTTSIILHII